MFKRRAVNDHKILILVRLLDVSKKFLIFLALFGQVGSLIPWNALQVKAETISGQEIVLDKTDTYMPDYPTTTDGSYDPSKIEIESEVLDKRDSTSKTFRKIDGTYEVAMYNDIIHYKEDGEWKQIDNSFNDLGDEIENTANKFKVKFPKKLDDTKQIRLSMDNYSINWNFLNIEKSSVTYEEKILTPINIKELTNIDQSILYKNIQPQVDVEYCLTGSKIKENIILNQYIENYSISFEYELGNLSLIKDENGNFVFVDVNGNTIFSFGNLVMYDNDDNDSFDININIIQIESDRYQVTIIPNDKWMMNAKYPVVIDPEIEIEKSTTVIQDSFVASNYPNNTYDDYTYISVGSTSYTYQRQAYIKFDLPKLVYTNFVTYAQMDLHAYTKITGQQLNIYRNTSAMNPSTVTWATRPTTENYIEDYHIIGSSYDYSFDITRSIKDWQTNTNNGFTIKQDNPYGGNNSIRSIRYTTNQYYRPTITIGYVDITGIKNYWDYDAQPLDSAGTGYILENYGTYSNVRNDIYYENTLSTLSLEFTYSSKNRFEGVSYGEGWRSNYEIELHQDLYGDLYVIFGDWSKVYYYEDSNACFDVDPTQYMCYISENGDGSRLLKETFGTTTFLINSTGIRYYIDSVTWLLESIVDANSRELSIERDTSNRIKYVRDSYGNYIYLYYSSSINYKLYSSYLYIHDTDTNTNNLVHYNYYYYQSDSTLNYVYTYDNYSISAGSNGYRRVTYDFDSDNKLISFYNDINKQKVEYHYTSGIYLNGEFIAKRVDYYQVLIDSLPIGRVDYSFNGFNTIKNDQYGNKVKLSFDQYGHTISICDDDGAAIFYEYQNNYSENTNYNLSNKLISISDNQNSQMNLLDNGDFEHNIYGDAITGGWYKNYSTYSGTLTYIYENNNLAFEIYRSSHASELLYLQQNIELDKGTYTLHGKIKNVNNPYISGGAFIEVIGASNIGETLQVFNTIDYTDIAITFDIQSDDTEIIIRLGNNSYGYAYFDDIEIETDAIDNRKNLVLNPSFEDDLFGWTYSNAYINNQSDDFMGSSLGNQVAKLYSISSASRSISQEINVFFNGGDILSYGSWLNGFYTSQNSFSSIKMSIGLKVVHNSGSPSLSYIDWDTDYELYFDEYTNEWQYKIASFEIPNAPVDYGYEGLVVKIEYIGENIIYVDGIQVYLKSSYTHQTFNDNGQVNSIYRSSSDVMSINYEYARPQELEEISFINSVCDEVISIVNDPFGNLEEIEKDNITTTFEYSSNDPGLLTSTKVESLSNYYFSDLYTFTNDNQYILTYTDSRNNTITYDYNVKTSLLDSIQLPNGFYQYYNYNENGKLTSSYIENNLGITDYTYDPITKQLKTISVDGLVYTVVYNSLGQINTIQVDGINLMTNDYIEKSIDNITYYTDLIQSSANANGNIYEFEYDEDDLLKKVFFKESPFSVAELQYEYSYDTFGRLAIYIDYLNSQKYYYTYNSFNQVISIKNDQNDIIIYEYNDQGNISSYKYSIEGKIRNVNYSYDTANAVYDATSYILDDSSVVTFDYSYDGNMANRLYLIEMDINNIDKYKKTIIYDDSETNGGLSTRPYIIIYSKNEGPISIKYHLEYSFDSMGNITSEVFKKQIYYINTLTSEEILFSRSFEYDKLNQLLRENYCKTECTINPVGFSNTYEYDQHGNLNTIREYGYTTNSTLVGTSLISNITPINTVSYEYYYSWDDQLTEYDNWTLEYDLQGNLIEMIDLSAGASQYFNWEGAELSSYERIDDYGTLNIEYLYNDQGIRVQKLVGSIVHSYFVDGERVIYETDGTNVIYYTYDLDRTLLSLNINGSEYFYQRNITNDIIGLYDESGNLVVRYEYDAWGNLVESIYDISGTNAGTLNPYRYKGYRYDTETNLYYLNSRYYNPEMHRFINADGYIGTPGEILSHNMYIYVKNNPINYDDQNGYFWDYAIDGIGVLMSSYDVCVNPSFKTWSLLGLDVVLAILPGAITIGSTKAASKGFDLANTMDNAGGFALKHGDDITDASKVGWKVGDDITNLTSAGNAPSWSTVRSRYWKNEAYFRGLDYPDDLVRMRKGLAPLDEFNNTGSYFSRELHHTIARSEGGTHAWSNLQQLKPWDHAEIDQYRFWIYK